MSGFLREIGMREEAERPETIVDSDDDRTFGGEVLAVIPREAARAAGETAAVDPQHHRPLVVRRVRAGPDVQIEAVFAACRLAAKTATAGAGAGASPRA